MDGDSFGGADAFGGDNFGGGHDPGPPAQSAQTGHPPAGGGDGDDAGTGGGGGLLVLGNLLNLGGLLGAQAIGLHAESNDGGDGLPAISASATGLNVDVLNDESGGGIVDVSADGDTLLEVDGNDQAPGSGIDIGLFGAAPDGNGVINIASGGERVIEVGGGHFGLPIGDLSGVDYDPSTGAAIDASLSWHADNADGGLLGGSIFDAGGLGATDSVLDILDVGIC